MTDYIDRQAAIDALCNVGCGSGYCGISCDDVKAIEQLPSVEVEPVKHGRWIPVAERLPENGSDVFGWCENFGIFPANYDHGRFFDCMFDRFADDVVAWMPLPEPYKGEGEAHEVN